MANAWINWKAGQVLSTKSDWMDESYEHYMRVKPCHWCGGLGETVVGGLSSKCEQWGCVNGYVIDTEGVSDV